MLPLQAFHLTLANIAGAVFDTDATACFSFFQKLAQESGHRSEALLSCNSGVVQVCICQCITSWLLFQVRDKEGAKQDLQNHALAYKRRELQVCNLHFLCTSCDDAAPCHVWHHPPSDFTLQCQIDVIASCFLSAEGCHGGIGHWAASLTVLFAVMFMDSKEDSKKDCLKIQFGMNKQTVFRNHYESVSWKPPTPRPPSRTKVDCCLMSSLWCGPG